MAQIKVITHEHTVVNASGPPNPSSHTFGPSGAYPPPPGPLDPAVVQVTVVSEPVCAQQMGPRSSRVTCKQCKSQVMTSVEKKFSMTTHIFAFALIFTCCCYLPYIMCCGVVTDHYCPSCYAYIGANRTVPF